MCLEQDTLISRCMQTNVHKTFGVHGTNVLSAILHINYRNLSGCQMITGSKCRTVAFIRSNNVMARICSIFIHQKIAQSLKL